MVVVASKFLARDTLVATQEASSTVAYFVPNKRVASSFRDFASVVVLKEA